MPSSAPSPRREQAVSAMWRTRRSTLILAVGAIVLMLVAMSPYALRSVAALPGMDWMRLSDVGETYGATSALLSAVALIGVALSVGLQAREALASRRQAARVFHHELIRMALDDPTYMQCWGTGNPGLTHDERRRYFYINLIIAYWEMLWDVGDVTEAEVRIAAAGQWFTNEAFRRFWHDWRDDWSAFAENQSRSRRRKFVHFLDEEYKNAVTAGPPAHRVTPAVTAAPQSRRRRHAFLGFVGGAVIGGLVVGGLLRKGPRMH